MKHLFLECIGRFGVFISLIIITNRTEWYQNLPIQTWNNTEPVASFLILGIVLSLVWVIAPTMENSK